MYTPEQQLRLDALRELYDTYDSLCDESDVIEADILAVQEAAEVSAWTDDMKSDAGVIVSLYEGQVYVQLGVRLKADMPEDTETSSVTVLFTSRQPHNATPAAKAKKIDRKCLSSTLTADLKRSGDIWQRRAVNIFHQLWKHNQQRQQP